MRTLVTKMMFLAVMSVVFTAVSSAQSPYPDPNVPKAIPNKIEAENYDFGGQGDAYYDTGTGNNGSAYRSDDVDIQTCSDTGGGYNVGWTDPGEWLEYTVNVATAGEYFLQARVGSPNSGKTFHVEFGGIDKTGSVAVPNTGDWGNWTTVYKRVTLSAGVQIMRFAFNDGGFNLNYINITKASTPYLGTLFTLPCKIQLEYYDLGGQNVAYYDRNNAQQGQSTFRTTEGADVSFDDGGMVISWWRASDEWMNYSINIPTAGTYAIRARYKTTSAANGNTKVEFISFNGTTVTVGTGGVWALPASTTSYTTSAYTQVTLPAGEALMKVTCNSDMMYPNWFEIVKIEKGDYDQDFDVDTADLNLMVDEWLNPDMTVTQTSTQVVNDLEGGLTGWNVETNSWNGVSTISLLTGTPTGQALQWTYDNAGGKYSEITYKWTSGINLNSYDRLRMKVKRHAGNSSEDLFFVKFLTGSGYAVAGEMIPESGDALHPITSNNPDEWVELSFDLSYYAQFPPWSAQTNGFYNIGQLTDIRGILIGCGGKSGAGTIDIDDIVLDTYIRDVAEDCDTKADWQWVFGAPFGVQDVNDVADPNRGAVVKLHYDDSVVNPLGNYSTDIAFVPDLVQSAGPIDLTQYDRIVVWGKYASGNSKEAYLYLDIFNGGIAQANFAVEAHVHASEPTQFYRERGLYPTNSTAQIPADKWLRWDIDLQGARHPLVFQTANGYTKLSQLTNVTAMLIGCTNETTAGGQGDIYIDSIELVTKPGCKSLRDLTGDCQVTLDDFKVLAQNWLKGK